MSRFEETVQNGVLILKSPLLADAGVRHGFTTRIGGVSTGDYSSLNLRLNCDDSPENVRENLARAARAVGFSPENCAMTKQVHGRAVRIIPAAEPAFSARPECDAVVCGVRGHALMSFGADCVTVLLHDTASGASAAVHAGWRGAVAGTVTAAVNTLAEVYGAAPRNILAAVGPSISGECYEVGPEVAEKLAAAHDMPQDELAAIMPARGDRYYPDLRSFAAFRLRAAGVPEANTDVDTHCTYKEPELFWSHRRTGDRRGVQAAIIVVK